MRRNSEVLRVALPISLNYAVQLSSGVGVLQAQFVLYVPCTLARGFHVNDCIIPLPFLLQICS